MKVITILFLLLLVSPAFGELTKDDLEAIRSIVKEEVTASEKRMREYIDLKIDGVEKSLNARIDGVEKSLNARIDAVDEKLSARIDGVHTRIDGLEGTISRIWLAILALIAAAVALPQLIIVYSERKRGREIERLLHELRSKEGPPPS